MRPLSSKELEQFNRDVDELVHKWALRLVGDDPAGWYNLASPLVPTSRDGRLALVAAWGELARDAQMSQKFAVEQAAAAGADYAEIGNATLISRQGARQKWPGLAEQAARARELEQRAGRAHTPDVYLLWHVDDRWSLTAAGSVVTIASKFDAHRDASDLDEAKQWAQVQLAARGLVVTGWRNPRDPTDSITPRAWYADVEPAAPVRNVSPAANGGGLA